MKLLPLLLLPFLASCTIKPTIRSGPVIVTLGGSIFTKSVGETSSYSGPLGTLNYATASNDETVIPGKAINYLGTKAAINGLTSALRTTESTKRVLSGHEVTKDATRSAADVEKLKILNPVEEVIPEAVLPPTAP